MIKKQLNNGKKLLDPVTNENNLYRTVKSKIIISNSDKVMISLLLNAYTIVSVLKYFKIRGKITKTKMEF